MPAERESKTEAPTPRRREEARSKGNVARSQDLAAAVLLLAAVSALQLLGPHMGEKLMAVMRTALTFEPPLNPDQLVPHSVMILSETLWIVGPVLLIVFGAVVAALYAQVGWLITLTPITPNLDKLNPMNGFKRMVSGRTFVMLLTNVGKLLLVGMVAALTLRESAAEIIFAFTVGFPEIFVLGSMLTMRLAFRLALVLLILALADFAYQRFRHEQDLKMSKDEVKDEFRSMEGDPAVRKRRRELQLEQVVQRLKQTVPQADVIVTNPTHLAVAIKYTPDEMPAPRVVAKGADHLAERIRQLALEHGIPIVQRRTLARALYEAVDIGEYVPERFYQAVAEILAYVYELTGRQPEMAGATAGATGAGGVP
jgi:flagellar biosynthetic protein FlhB